MGIDVNVDLDLLEAIAPLQFFPAIAVHVFTVALARIVATPSYVIVLKNTPELGVN